MSVWSCTKNGVFAGGIVSIKYPGKRTIVTIRWPCKKLKATFYSLSLSLSLLSLKPNEPTWSGCRWHHILYKSCRLTKPIETHSRSGQVPNGRAKWCLNLNDIVSRIVYYFSWHKHTQPYTYIWYITARWLMVMSYRTKLAHKIRILRPPQHTNERMGNWFCVPLCITLFTRTLSTKKKREKKNNVFWLSASTLHFIAECNYFTDNAKSFHNWKSFLVASRKATLVRYTTWLAVCVCVNHGRSSCAVG